MEGGAETARGKLGRVQGRASNEEERERERGGMSRNDGMGT